MPLFIGLNTSIIWIAVKVWVLYLNVNEYIDFSKENSFFWEEKKVIYLIKAFNK